MEALMDGERQHRQLPLIICFLKEDIIRMNLIYFQVRVTYVVFDTYMF